MCFVGNDNSKASSEIAGIFNTSVGLFPSEVSFHTSVVACEHNTKCGSRILFIENKAVLAEK